MLFTSLEITKGTNKAAQTNTYPCVCLRSFLWMCQDTNLSHRWLRGASPIPRGPELRQLQRSPDLSSESPSLCVCHALKPLEGFLPAINVTIFSCKINEPALTGQMTLSKISSSSGSGIFPYLLSLCYALCFLKGRSGNLSVCANVQKIQLLFLCVCVFASQMRLMKQLCWRRKEWFALLAIKFVFAKQLHFDVSMLHTSTFYLLQLSDIIKCAVHCNNNFGIRWLFNTSSVDQNINYTLPTTRPPLFSYSKCKALMLVL